MSSNGMKLRQVGRNARAVLVALVMVVSVGSQPLTGKLDAQTRLNALPESVSAVPSFNVPSYQDLYCASDDMKLNRCSADTRGGVRLVRQRSGSPCIQGRTWGRDRGGVWVDGGCRADFEVRR